jgi:para-aminobenzoate synthetase component 1
MRKKITVKISDIQKLILNTVFVLKDFEQFIILNSNSDNSKNNPNNRFSDFDFISAFGKFNNFISAKQNNFQTLKNFYESRKDWLFGFFTYDLKNEIENSKSKNFDGIQMPEIFFFNPNLFCLKKIIC